MQVVSVSLDGEVFSRLSSGASAVGQGVPEFIEGILRDIAADMPPLTGSSPQVGDASVAPPDTAPLSEPIREAQESPTISFSPVASTLSSLGKLDDIFCETLGQLGIDVVAEPIHEAPGGEIRAWSCLILRVGTEWSSWLDFRISMSRKGCEFLYESMSGEAATSEAQLCDAFAESLNILQGAVKFALEGESAFLIMPFLPRATRCQNGWREMPADSMSWLRRFRSADDVVSLEVGIIETNIRTSARKTSVVLLEPSSVTLEKVFSSPESTVPLINAGTVLSERVVDRLRNLRTPQKRPAEVMVVQPSKWALELSKD